MQLILNEVTSIILSTIYFIIPKIALNMLSISCVNNLSVNKYDYGTSNKGVNSFKSEYFSMDR